MSRKQQRRTRDRHMAFVRGRIVHLNDLHLRCAIIVWDQSQVDEMFRVCPPETNPQRRRRIVEENRAMRRMFAVCVPADQTALWIRPDGSETTVHAEAAIFRTHAEAEAVAAPIDGWIDDVDSLREFKSREDTWPSWDAVPVFGFRERNGRRSAIGAT